MKGFCYNYKYNPKKFRDTFEANLDELFFLEIYRCVLKSRRYFTSSISLDERQSSTPIKERDLFSLKPPRDAHW